MTRKTAKDIHPEALKLFDEYRYDAAAAHPAGRHTVDFLKKNLRA